MSKQIVPVLATVVAGGKRRELAVGIDAALMPRVAMTHEEFAAAVQKLLPGQHEGVVLQARRIDDVFLVFNGGVAR